MKKIAWVLILILCVSAFQTAEARKKHHHGRRKYRGPLPTHPVILWSRTLQESTDPAQRKVAAFKLSQYSQPIFQEAVIHEILKCMKDSDKQIKVLCTKALGNASPQAYSDTIRKALLDQYANEETMRNSVVRVFIKRKDSSPKVQDTFMETAKKSSNPDDLMVVLGYFEIFGSGSPKFVENLAEIYRKQDNIKVKRAVVKVLADRAEGQDTVVDLLAECAQNKDTPLALTCLGGLQVQAKKDTRAWAAIEKTIGSDDPDVLMASLDVVNALPATRNEAITNRLVSLISDVDDSEIQEKAVLALGVVGTQTEEVVTTLLKLLAEKDTDESVRIAAALILGKQAVQFPDKTMPALQACTKSGVSQSFRTACQLGLSELESHKVIVKTTPAPPSIPVSPISEVRPAKMPLVPTPSAISEVKPAPGPPVQAEKSDKKEKGEKDSDKEDAGRRR